MNLVAEELRQAEETLGPYCENCGWWIKCLTQLTGDQRKVQYASCHETAEPCFVFDT